MWVGKTSWVSPAGLTSVTPHFLFEEGTTDAEARVTVLFTAVDPGVALGLYRQQYIVNKATGLWTDATAPDPNPPVLIDTLPDFDNFIESIERSATGSWIIKFGTSSGA